MTLERGITSAIAAMIVVAATGRAAAAALPVREVTASSSPRLVVFEEFSRPT